VEAGALLAVALVVVAVLLGGFVLLGNRRRGRAAAGPPDGTELLAPDDLAELAALLDQVEVEERHARDSLLITRLDVLVAREIPVRRVIPAAGVPGAATVGFADGTAVTVASRKAAEAGVLLLHATKYRVLLRGYRTEGGHLVLRFRRDGSGRDLEVVALGLEQPS
jgi:hypothetical protein